MGEKGDQETRNSIFRYNSPLVQVGLIGLLCFCCLCMFNALSGMGGGGQVNHTAANNANTALYTTFAVFGILGGGIYNILGPRLTLFTGCSTCILYAGSFLYYNHHKHQTFAIFAGALLGIDAGLLWAGQGAIMTAYPPPHRKGIYISMFWSIFNMGGVIDGLIPFIMNYNRETAITVNDGTYIGFMIFMTIGALLSLAILHPSRVIQDDGSSCTKIKYSNVITESAEIANLFLNWKMLLIVLPAFASNFCYTYQFNNVNGALFNLRTRGLNNLFYWGAQMFGSAIIGYIMDFSFKSRKMRGLAGITVVAVVGNGIWIGGLFNQRGYNFQDVQNNTIEILDFKNSGSHFAGPFVLYFSYGLLDAMFQSMIYWIIGGLAYDSVILSRYVGFYKGVQSAGAAMAWQVDTHKVPYMTQLIVNWSSSNGLFGGGYAINPYKYSNVITESAEIANLFLNWKMLLIVLPAFASNFCYTYQFNNVNGALFNLRTRGLNNLFYWGAQMFGSAIIGYIMDFSFKSRKMRGLAGITVVAVVGNGIWIGGLFNQRGYNFQDVQNNTIEILDFKNSGSHFAGPFVLYFSYGLLDAMFQSMIYWIIGGLAYDSVILSRYVGFYKGVQSAGAAMAWQVDTHKVPYMTQLIVNWVLITISYPLLALLVIKAIKEEDKVASPSGSSKESNKELTKPTC